MRLKHYQEKVLKELKAYLSALADAKKEFDKREAIKEKDNRREMERTRLTVSKYNADK